MNARFALLALAALVALPRIAVAGTYSIFFNDYTEATSSCHIDNVSGVQSSTIGSVNLVATAASPLAFVNCGTGSGSAPVVSLGISPTSVNAGAAAPGNQSTLTWSANNVSSCNITGSDAGVATEFPNQWLGTTVACGGTSNKCAGSPNTVTLTPIVNGANGNYTFGLQCTDGVTTVSTTKILAVTGSTATGGTPTANFTFSPNALTVSFTDTSTSTGSLGNLVYSWNFGDTQVSGGGTSTAKNPIYSYTAAGTYNVTETVTDSVSGAQDSIAKPVTVTLTGATSCTTGQAGDMSGYSALCFGNYVFYDGSKHTVGPAAYTFPFVFGGVWPGAYTGYVSIFTMNPNQFVSIPIQPTPGRSVSFSINPTFMPSNKATLSVSTSPGLFNNGVANGTTVLCVMGGSTPSITTTSDGLSGAACNMNPNQTYWLNMMPTFLLNGTFTQCAKAPCSVAVGERLLD
ncbi:MAG: PKD domain-containing protein [Proteobacteria bacterium]|nr:PKD domain-containing protein [Pseudomonadota bacterium]